MANRSTSLLVLVVLGAILIAASPPRDVTSSTREAEVEGVVMVVARGGETIMLVDGTRLDSPKNVRVEHLQLKPGDKVKASFETQDGRNVVTSIQVVPAGVPVR